MVIMILEKVPASMKGELSRWLFEIDTGIYIGHVSARVRDLLWEKCCGSRGRGRIFQAWSTNNEQRFTMREDGYSNMKIEDWEGLTLIKHFVEPLSEAKRRRIRAE